MTLLDDARRIQNGGAIDVNGRCYFCGFDLSEDDPHSHECPWPSMFDIVAALEVLKWYAEIGANDSVELLEDHGKRAQAALKGEE